MLNSLDQGPHNVVSEAVHKFQAAGTRPPDGATLTAALLALERTAKQTQQAIPLETLVGTWRLCFSAGKKAKFKSGQPVGSGFYVPKLAIARITFAPSDDSEASISITNELRIGPLSVRFTGPARYPGQKNLLAFDFTHLRIQCFGLTVYSGEVGRQKRADQSFEDTAVGKLPFFAFFAATGDYIAARGRGGGLAVWINDTFRAE